MAQVKVHLSRPGGEIAKTVRFIIAWKNQNLNFLRQKLRWYFPKLKGGKFSIQWTDDDGDCITVHSGDCFEAMATFFKDSIWKITAIPLKGPENKIKNEVKKQVRPVPTEPRDKVERHSYKDLRTSGHELHARIERRRVQAAGTMVHRTSPTQVTMAPPDDCMITNIAPGDYQLVTWDLDTTGKRLIDEICHIAAYCPDKLFTQYVMPYRNPSPGARRSFGIRVVNVGRLRMLKNIRNGKILQTKSEISALNDFIRFLEEAKDQKEGVILVCHETRKLNVPLLLEALQRFNLTDSFFRIVRGFGNSFPLSEKSCEDVKYHTLRNLCKYYLESFHELDNAAGRAKALYEVLQSMLQGSVQYDNIKSHCVTPDTEKKELQVLKDILKKQGTLRPIFENEMQKSRRERQRASILRRLVAEGGVDYEMLSESYKRDGMEAVSRCLKERLSAEDGIDELIQLMEDHFEPQPEVESKSETTDTKDKPSADTGSAESKPKTEARSTEDKPKAETAIRPRRAPKAQPAAKPVRSPKTTPPPKTTTKDDPEPQVETAHKKEVVTDQEVNTGETSEIRKE